MEADWNAVLVACEDNMWDTIYVLSVMHEKRMDRYPGGAAVYFTRFLEVTAEIRRGKRMLDAGQGSPGQPPWVAGRVRKGR